MYVVQQLTNSLSQNTEFEDSVLTFLIDLFLVNNSYMVTALMGADLNSILKCQKLTDEHVQFLVYQILRGLKVRTDYAQINVD